MTVLRVGAAVAALLSAAPVNAQTLADRIGGTREGTVRLSYPARDGLCGNGRDVRVTSRSWRTDEDWEPDCETGPARVVIRRAGGDVRSMRLYIGGRWRARSGSTDLGTVSGPEAASYFLELTAHPRSEVAKQAVRAAFAARDGDVRDAFLDLARDHGRAVDVRASAVGWLGRAAGDSVVSELHRLLDADLPSEIHEQAVFALSQHGSDRAGRVLRDLATDGSMPRELRKRTIFWLGQGTEADGVRFLRDLFDRIDDAELRERVLFSVSQTREAGGEDWLVGVGLDDDEAIELRKKALFWAGQMRGATPRLLDLYDRVEHPDLKEHLVFVYSQRRRDAAALEKLMDIARADSDDHLRRRAIFWLGQSRDPRAAEFLAELIRG